VKEPSAALAASIDDLVVEGLGTGERLFVRRDDVHACAQQRRVRLCDGRGGRVVHEHDRVVVAHERGQRRHEVGGAPWARAGAGGRGLEESAPVGGGRDAVWVEDGRFGIGERDEAKGVWWSQCLELAHELGADESNAYDGNRDASGGHRLRRRVPAGRSKRIVETGGGGPAQMIESD